MPVGQRSELVTASSSRTTEPARRASCPRQSAGTDAATFVVDSDDCAGKSLAPSAQCTLQMHFAPSQPTAMKTATLTVTDANGDSVVVALTGIASEPATLTSLLPATQDFGTVVVGSSSQPLPFTLRNNDVLPTGAITISIRLADQEQFKIAMDGCSGQTVQPGASCTVQVAFAPANPGMKQASLEATVAGGPTLASSLTGTGAANATFQIAPAEYDFGSLSTGSASPARSFLLKNIGGVPSGSPIAIQMSAGPQSGDFTIANNACTAQLQPMGSCTFTVAFKPSTNVAEVGTLTAGAPGTTTGTLSLTGVGLAPAALKATPTQQNFGAVSQGSTSANTTFTITNTGWAASSALTASIAGTDAGQFQIASNTCSGVELAHNASCTVAVGFAPNKSANAGNLQAQLLVAGGMVDGTASASLSGTVLAPAVMAIGPTSYSFGVAPMGDQTKPFVFTVTNSGSEPSGPPAVTQTGSSDFKIVSTTCTGTPIPGNNGTCTVSVAFQPTAAVWPGQRTISVSANPGQTVMGRDRRKRSDSCVPYHRAEPARFHGRPPVGDIGAHHAHRHEHGRDDFGSAPSADADRHERPGLPHCVHHVHGHPTRALHRGRVHHHRHVLPIDRRLRNRDVVGVRRRGHRCVQFSYGNRGHGRGTLAFAGRRLRIRQRRDVQVVDLPSLERRWEHVWDPYALFVEPGLRYHHADLLPARRHRRQYEERLQHPCHLHSVHRCFRIRDAQHRGQPRRHVVSDDRNRPRLRDRAQSDGGNA